MQLEFTARRRGNFLNGSSIYFKKLNQNHQAIATTKTDADGKFTLKITDEGEFALVANAQRETPNNVDLYFWAVSARERTDLTNENLTSASGDSFLHVAGKDDSIDPSVTEDTLQADLNKIKTTYADVFAAIAKAQQQRESPSLPPTPTHTPTPLPSSVTITQPVSVKVPYGSVTIERGTRLPLIGRDGPNVRVDGDQIIPVSATDLK